MLPVPQPPLPLGVAVGEAVEPTVELVRFLVWRLLPLTFLLVAAVGSMEV
jgi:TRAP-type mannitol/chloroaromatic compound transport system permease small subunit